MLWLTSEAHDLVFSDLQMLMLIFVYIEGFYDFTAPSDGKDN